MPEAKPTDVRERAHPDGTDVGPSHRGRPTVKRLNVLEHPIAQHALTGLRNKDTASQDFREVCEQLLLFLTVEATRSLPVHGVEVATSAGRYEGKSLAKPVIFLSVTREALGLANNVADLIPNVLIGAVSLDQRGSQRPVPRMHLTNAPALSEARVILFDPVVATGLSASLALGLLRNSGAADLTLVSFVCSSQGLAHLQSKLPDLTVWTAAIDAEWDAKRGPIPGLGNFSERMYG